MKYQPVTCVWEVTMGCNMRCGHCGSSCAEPLPDELSTEEALDLAGQIARLGLRWVTLSGGEPLTRRDLPFIVARLKSKGVMANIITNGWLLDEYMIRSFKDAGVATIAISVDGTEDIHDDIRKKGSYRRLKEGFKMLKKHGVTTGAVTTVTKRNLPVLPQMRQELIEMGADSWQLQIGLPMGNLKERPEWLIEPEDISTIIDFCYETACQGTLKVFPADCIGYYTKKETEIRKIAYNIQGVPMWEGCNAGVRGFGILHNGDILGCTSIRDREYIEGNIRQTPLADIWNGENAFSWRRKMKKQDLAGDCGKCNYGSKCLGGCPNTRLTMNHSLQSENQYCAYNFRLKKTRESLQKMTDPAELLEQAQQQVRENRCQKAALYCGRILEIEPEHLEALRLKGYAEFMCGNYDECVKMNEAVLSREPDDVYATKGLGLAMYRMGKKDEGVRLVEKAAAMTGFKDEDILNDLNVLRKDMAMSNI